MANMTFKANLLPNTDLGYSLGSSTNKWKIYGDQYQQFDYLDANSEETVGSYIRGLIDAGYESGWFESVAAANRGCPTEENNAWYVIEFRKNKIGNGITLIAYKYGVHDILYEGLLWKNGEDEASWTQIMTQSSADNRYVNVSGDTMTGPLYINNTTDVGLNQNGALIIGNKTGYNIGIDNDEIMARNNSAASTLYLNNEGGAVRTGWLQVINNSSNNSNDAMVYLENQNNSDWAQKILLSTYNYGLFISGTGTNLLKVGDNNTLYIGNADAQVNGTILKITNNSNTLSIGSQNSTYTHIYNSADIPFIFNKDVNSASKNWLGSISYPWGGLRLGGSSPSIQYQGTKANRDMITMIDNTNDTYGNGIRIGGGGLTIIGGGESASTLQSNLGYTGGSEAMVIGNDGNIEFYPGQDSYDASAKCIMSASRFWAGVNGNTTREAQVGVQSGAGQLYMWSHAATTGSRGLYSPAHGTGSARALVTIDTNNRVYIADSYTGTSTALAYSQSALAASAITYLTCWNGYELRAITKAEMANAVDSAHKWVRIGGDTMTGQLNNTFGGSSTARHYENVAFYENNASSYTGTIKIKLPNTTSNMVMMVFRIIIFDYNANSGCDLLVSGYTYNDKKWYNAAAAPQGTFTKGVRLAHDGTNYCILLGTTSSTWNYSKIILADVYSGYNAQPATGYAISLITSESGYTISQTLTTLLRADKIWGAVWNDYAEYRKNNEEEKELQQPGRCVHEIGDGRLALTTERLMRGCEIISDTFGFAIGQDIDNGYDTPIASNGRVLAYPYESIEEFATHIGYAVCSGPGGTVSIMTDDEARNYPWCIIGMISEIPTYEKWGTGNVNVDGRIWIRIR